MKIPTFMRTIPSSPQNRTKGFALLITLIFLGVVLIIFGSIMGWVSSTSRVTQRNNQYNRSSAAAESAVERVLAQMDRDFNYGSLTTADYYATLTVNQTNWPITYTFNDPTGGRTNGIYVFGSAPATNSTPLESQYAGLYGFAWNWTIKATATPVLGNGNSIFSVPATVSESMNFASIPIFQFAIFYNINLEIAPGNAMTISGPVFCNQSIWASAPSGGLTFSSTVQAVQTVNTTTTEPFATSYTSGAGAPTFSLTGQPTAHNNSIVMPIGTNNNPNAVQGIIQLPPSSYDLGSAAAFSTNGQVYLANAADLYITNSPAGTNSASPTGTNTFVYYQDGSLASRQTLLVPDYYKLKTGESTNYVSTNLTAGKYSSTNVKFASYSFITNMLFYDWREGWNGGSGISGKGKAIQAVQIDIAALNNYITNYARSNSAYTYDSFCVTDKGHHIDSIYVYTAVQPTTTMMPAVRLANGAQLPSPGGTRNGLTVATQFPMYIWGNYNSQDSSGSALGLYGSAAATLHTLPSAIMADSITILSPSWSDATTSKLPTPSAITVNAAMLEGIVPSNPAISGNYSGGVENFLRLLENWGSQTLTYNGSIVVMFPSSYATNYWVGPGGSGYYGAPIRNWAFDLDFTKGQNYLPPLTPQTKALIRGTWLAK